MRTNDEHWAFDALRRRLKERTQTVVPPLPIDYKEGDARVLSVTKPVDWERGTIFLINPDALEEIDQVFFGDVYPRVLAALEGEPFVVPSLDKIKEHFRNCRGIDPTKGASFILSDPKRLPGTAARPPWSIAFTLEVGVEELRLATSLGLSLPFWSEAEWLLDFLADSRFQEVRPTLHVEDGCYLIGFTSSKHAWYPDSDGSWEKAVIAPFPKHIKIAAAVDRYLAEPENRVLKSQMVEAIAAVYNSNF